MFCSLKQRQKHPKQSHELREQENKAQILLGFIIPLFFLKEHFYAHANCIQMAPAAIDRFFKKGFLAVCIFYFEVPTLTLHKILEFPPPPFSKRNFHCYLSFDQENSQNLPTSSTQAAQLNSLNHQLLIQVLSSPPAPSISLFWVVKTLAQPVKHILFPASLHPLPSSPWQESDTIYPQPGA